MATLRGIVSFPIPAYSNVPIEPQYYIPSRFVISAITLGQLTTITTSVNHNYVVGQEVRLLIPPLFGTRQLNEQKGFVISIPAVNQVILNIDSLAFDPFIASLSITPNQPQILAIGDVNNGSINNQGRVNNITFIQGSFLNISPL